MPSCIETCNTGAMAGSVIGGLVGFALDFWVSMTYVRPFVDHLTDTNNKTEEVITGTIAILILPLFVVPAMLVGKIAGPPTAVALRGLYACGSAGFSALSKVSLFRHQDAQPAPSQSSSQDLEAGERTRLLPS